MASAHQPKLAALTSLRFVAAAFIVFAHIRGDFGLSPRLGLENFQFAQGVSFFFVLSGFILTYVYQRLESREDVRRFLVARIARLWPAHVLALGISAAFLVNPGLGWNTRTLLQSLASVTMIHAWIPNSDYQHFLNSVAWSISTEYFFYLAFIVLVARLGQTWVWKLSLCFCLAIIACLAGQSGHLPGFPNIPIGALTYINPVGRLFEFMLGMCLALAFRRLQTVQYGVWVGTATECAAFALMFAAAHLVHRHGQSGGWLADHLGATIGDWLSWGPGAAPAFGVLIVVLALERGWLSKALGAPPLVLLGELSYSVYLLHILLKRFYQQHAAAFEGTPDWLMLVGFWTILLLLSHIVWSAWERPLRTWILARWGRRAADSAPRVTSDAAPPATNWSPLFAPGGKLIAAEVALLAALCIPVYQFATRPTYSLVSAEELPQLTATSLLRAESVEFDGRFRLRSVTYQAGDGGYNVSLVWESCQDQLLDNWVCLHLLDAEQNRRTEIGRLQDSRGRMMRQGAYWREDIFVSHDQIAKGATALAIGLWHPQRGTLPSPQAVDDHEHWRVLLPVPSEQLALRDSASSTLKR